MRNHWESLAILTLATAGSVAARGLATACPANGQVAVSLTINSRNLASFAVLWRGQSVAAEIMASAGVIVSRTTALECEVPPIAVQVEFVTGRPDDFKPGALAYATPFASGSKRIFVMWDRVQQVRAREYSASVLGHVLAHELTHVLQGMSRHSSDGLMKAEWNRSDFQRMSVDSLPFTEDDIHWIRMGAARYLEIAKR